MLNTLKTAIVWKILGKLGGDLLGISIKSRVQHRLYVGNNPADAEPFCL